MKDVLADMHRNNIRRARFRGQVDALNERGAVGIRDIDSSTGGTISHVWIGPDQWSGPLPKRWDHIEILADVRQYWKGNGIPDFGLFNVRVLR